MIAFPFNMPNLEKEFYSGERMPNDGGKELKIKALCRHACAIDDGMVGDADRAAVALRTLREDARHVDPLVAQVSRKLEKVLFNQLVPTRDELS